MDQQKGDVGTIKIDPLVTAWAVNIAFGKNKMGIILFLFLINFLN